MDTDDMLEQEQHHKELASEKFDKELDDIISAMLMNSARLRYLYNKGSQDTREAVKEAVAEVYKFFS